MESAQKKRYEVSIEKTTMNDVIQSSCNKMITHNGRRNLCWSCFLPECCSGCLGCLSRTALSMFAIGYEKSNCSQRNNERRKTSKFKSSIRQSLELVGRKCTKILRTGEIYELNEDARNGGVSPPVSSCQDSRSLPIGDRSSDVLALRE